MGLVEVAGGLQGALRSLEKVFGELVLGAKWVEEGALRKKLVRESHVETHEGEFHLFWRLLKRGFFWKDMRKDCRAKVRSCVDCLCFNVGARGFMLLRVRSVKLLMVEVYGDHVRGRHLLILKEVEHQVCTLGAHEQNAPVERCVKEV